MEIPKQFKYFFSVVVFLFFTAVVSAQEEIKTDFESVIKQADQYFSSGDYINAKTSYQYATRLRPSDKYAKDKLQETIGRLRDQMVVMEQYTAVISEADDFFRQGDYENARKKYVAAAKIVPAEKYPAEKIKEIEQKESEIKKLRITYDDAVYRAEKFEKYHRYDEAIAEYEKALALFPDEQIPKDKIEELKNSKVEYEANVNAYDDIIANADRLFGLKYYENARSEYEKASEARPDEDYPLAKIKEIDNLLLKRTDFNNLVDQGDELYMNKELQKAKEKYQAALTIYPSESYPKDM
ncbi:MAG: hypothetical protein IH594_01035, partial [Bacteroidales bacterium]|nr:hypothetical protein [Bacteroidales bacterium]